MATLADLFKGKAAAVAEQLLLWQVLGQLVGAAMGPELQWVTNEVNKACQQVPLSPPDLAQLVVRNFLPLDQATEVAKESGLAPDDFLQLVHAAGDAPAPGDLATALRRGVIPEHGSGADSTSFDQGIREGRLADKWLPMIKALAQEWPTPTDALDALLQGQVDHAEGAKLYERFGGDPDYFQLLFNTRGSAPTPLEAAQMANRGAIPWEGTGPDVVSFQQAFLEGPWRDKWLDPYRAISQYYPPPRTITAMVAKGSMTDAQGLQLLKEQGLPDQLAAAYIADAHMTKTTATHQLAETLVTQLYEDQFIDRATATSMLEALKYSSDDAGFILDLADFQRARAALGAAVNRVHSLYVGHKLARGDAGNALRTLKIPPAQVDQLLTTWDLEAAANVKLPSEAQVTGAFHYQVIDLDTAMGYLEALGYSPYDAWLVLSEREHAPVGPPPPKGPGQLGSTGTGG